MVVISVQVEIGASSSAIRRYLLRPLTGDGEHEDGIDYDNFDHIAKHTWSNMAGAGETHHSARAEERC